MRMKPTRPSASSEWRRGPVVVTGAAGMLGWEVVRHLEWELGREAVIPLSRAELDVTRPDVVGKALQELRPTVLINCAAYTNVDRAESERELAEAANGRAPGVLAVACAEMGTALVHFSTDYVFDGSVSRPRTEDEPPSPVNAYGETKLQGERAALAYGDSLVLRVQWLYGERKDRFSPLRERKEFFPFSDQYGAPTWTRDIARALPELLDRDARGLFHFAYDDHASWAEVFAFVKEQWNLEVRLAPRSTASAALPARRPAFGVLSNRKLCDVLGRQGMGSWRESLAEFLKHREMQKAGVNPSEC